MDLLGRITLGLKSKLLSESIMMHVSLSIVRVLKIVCVLLHLLRAYYFKFIFHVRLLHNAVRAIQLNVLR